MRKANRHIRRGQGRAWAQPVSIAGDCGRSHDHANSRIRGQGGSEAEPGQRRWLLWQAPGEPRDCALVAGTRQRGKGRDRPIGALNAAPAPSPETLSGTRGCPAAGARGGNDRGAARTFALSPRSGLLPMPLTLGPSTPAGRAYRRRTKRGRTSHGPRPQMVLPRAITGRRWLRRRPLAAQRREPASVDEERPTALQGAGRLPRAIARQIPTSGTSRSSSDRCGPRLGTPVTAPARAPRPIKPTSRAGAAAWRRRRAGPPHPVQSRGLTSDQHPVAGRQRRATISQPGPKAVQNILRSTPANEPPGGQRQPRR